MTFFKNTAIDAIPNQNSVLFLLGPSRETEGWWGGGARTNNKLPRQARGHPFLYNSTLFLLTYLTSLVTYLVIYSLNYLLIY